MKRKKIVIILVGMILLSILLAGCNESETNTTTDEDTNGNSNETKAKEDDNIEEENKDEDLIGYWKFDEEKGVAALDSANGFHGTVSGGATWSAGKVGNSLYFDGIDDHVILPSSAIENIKDLAQGTISFWFNYESLLDEQPIMPIFYLGNDNVEDSESIFIIEIGHSDPESPIYTLDPSNKKLYVTWTDWENNNLDPLLCYDSLDNLEENTWYHFALVVGPDGNTGYLNGIEMNNRNYNFGSPSDQMFFAEITAKELFTFGYGKTHHIISPTFVYYKGYIDELKIYNRPLSLDEIRELL